MIPFKKLMVPINTVSYGTFAIVLIPSYLQPHASTLSTQV